MDVISSRALRHKDGLGDLPRSHRKLLGMLQAQPRPLNLHSSARHLKHPDRLQQEGFGSDGVYPDCKGCGNAGTHYQETLVYSVLGNSLLPGMIRTHKYGR